MGEWLQGTRLKPYRNYLAADLTVDIELQTSFNKFSNLPKRMGPSTHNALSLIMQLLTRKFTTEQYHKMADVGILTAQDRVELIRGEIIEMSPIGLKHAATVNRLNQLFQQRLGQKVIVSIQNPIQLQDNSEPQPDVALLKPRPDFYTTKMPTPADIFLLVEVADRTLKYDRDVKIPLYAENGIIEVWLLDVNNQSLKAYRQPQGNSYQSIQEFTRGQSLSPLAFPETIINVDEIFFFSSQSN